MKRHDKMVEDIDKLEDVFAKNNHRYVYADSLLTLYNCRKLIK